MEPGDRFKALVAAIVLGVLAWVVVVKAPSVGTEVEAGIALATTVIGFVTLVYGATMGAKAAGANRLTLTDVQPIGLTTAVGALLLLVGRLA